MQQKFKKPLFLIFFISLVILGGLCLVSFLAFNFGRSKQQTVLITPMPVPKIGSPKKVKEVKKVKEALSVAESPTLFPTATTFRTASPTINPSPISTATPLPTKVIFNIGPLVLLNPSKTQLLGGNASLDGYRSSNNGGSTTVEIWVGRNNVANFRGFVSFDLKSLPGNITIEKAILKMNQIGIVGKPYVTGGNVVVDHLDYGTSLEATDYNRVAIKTHIGVLSNDDTFGEKNLEVTDSVKNDLYYKRGRSQYRLRLATETIGGNSSGDIVYFDPEENIYSDHRPPQLEITFRKN